MTWLARPAGVTVNGTDLGVQFGFLVDRPGQFLSAGTRRYPAQQVYGRDRQLVLGEPDTGPLELALEGTVQGSSHADLVARIDALKQWLSNGVLQVTTQHDTSRYHLARLVGTPVVAIGPAFLTRGATFAAQLVAHDPCAYATSTTTVSFTTTPQACALGSAPSWGIITITGSATNPLLTLKNSAGTTLETIGFALALGSGDTLVIDCDRKTVVKTISSVSSNAIDAISTNTAYSFLGLDPHDGDQLTSAWPTLQVSSGSGQVVYRKRWR